MRRYLVRARLATLCLAVPLPLVAQTAPPFPADVASPEAIVWALYETVSRQSGEPFDWDRPGRGINSIQLRYHDGRWWVVSIAWDEESGAGPLPARYRPR